MGLLCILMASCTLAIIYRKKWIEALPVSAFMIMLLTYTIGIVNLLDKIWIMKWGIILGCTAGLFFHLRTNDRNEWRIKEKISAGMLLLTGVALGMALLLSSHLIIEWDDLSHWAITVKQMFYIKSIPNGQNAFSSYNDYPPIGALFIYWFLSDFKEFHEFLFFPVYYFSVLICLVPFYEKISGEKNEICKNVIASLICLLLPGAFASTAMVNLKIDSFVAVLFMFIVISVLEIVFGEEKLCFWDMLKIFSALSVMMLTKSVGIFLSIVITLALLIFARTLKDKKNIIACIAGTLIEIVFYVSWKLYCEKYGSSSYISTGFGEIKAIDYLRTLKAVFVQMPWFLYPVLFYIAGMLLFAIFSKKNKLPEKRKHILLMSVVCIDIAISFFCRYGYLNQWFEALVDDGSKEYVTKHYIYYFCRQSVTFQREENVTYGISALECIMLITLIMLMVRYLTDDDKYKKYLIIQTVLWGGFIVYVVGHLAMYRYMFYGLEASGLAAYSRYLMMYIAGLVGGNFYLLYSSWLKTEKRNYYQRLEGLLLGSIIFISNIPFTYMCIRGYHDGYFAKRWEYRDKALSVVEKVRQEIKDTEGGVWITNDSDAGWMMNETRYHFVPDKGFELSRVWILDNTSEDVLSEMMRNEDEAGEIRYLVVDTSEVFSEENQRKLERILEHYQFEEKKDYPVCVYKL